jgi:HEAT repeat protein
MVVTLWDWHDLGEEALPLLREALRSGSADVRKSAVEALDSYARFPSIAEHAVDAEAAARELAPVVADPSPDVRASVLETLREFGPLAAPAVPGLIRLLDGPDRRDAARVLRKIGRPAKAAAPKLAELLRKDEDREVRIAAAGALGGMGKEAGKHSHALFEAGHNDPDETVRLCAIHEGMRSSIETGNYAIGVGGGGQR